MTEEGHSAKRWPIDDALRAALDTALPVEHYQNVGRVAVHATWLEEVAGLILYASQGEWDMTFDHLKLADNKQRMLRELRRVAESLPDTETPTLLSTGETRTDRGVVKRELNAFIDDLAALLDRRDRIVHSVPWQDVFGTDVEVVHPRSVRAGAADARTPLPTTDECEELVRDLVAAMARGHWLAPRVGALKAQA